MEELDFTNPQPAAPAAPAVAPAPAPAPAAAASPKTATSQFYDRAIAAKIFQACGRSEKFAAGATIFAQDQKSSSGGLFSRGSESRMYFIAAGQVTILAGGRPIDSLGEGEIFGEGAVITSSAPARSEGESAPIAMVKWDVACSAGTLDIAGRTARVVRLGA